ncbi:MAG: tRNA (cytidine(56)-2'-O)-methyltransferase [Candidatus Bathyarchaeia archaeon]|nr:tRNA (cytidine(56)-2'-O)-methyltransferase [Candidatus Bathyarchaeota archaeon]
MKVVVLRWGHRYRDIRVTSHVALTARAFGASGLVLADSEDKTVERTIKRVIDKWGGTFKIEMGVSWRNYIKSWKDKGGIIVHLTMYGENIKSSDVMQRIRFSKKNILVLVGSQKVPSEFYDSDVSDFNVAIGNQPHSEVAAIAVFLDRLFENNKFSDIPKGKFKVLPSDRKKRVISTER